MLYSTTLAASLLFLTTNAHMILQSPVPYADSKDKSPLAADGSNFPCKSVPYTVTSMNDWPIGSSQTLQWSGTATHGGGSCQVSVTLDKAPTKSSVWKVIYSIEGGCPDNVPGNLPDGDQKQRPAFNFTIPPELPNGEYSMAASWFNHVGNREMYMVCAPVKVSGGKDDTAAFNSLPNMAIANVAGQGDCKTPEGFDYEFENPGKYKTKGGAGPFKPLCGGAGGSSGGGSSPAAPQQPGAPASPGAPAAPAAPPVASPPAASPPNPAAPSAAITSTIRQVVTVTAPSGAAPTPAAPSPNAPAAPAPAAPSAAPAPPQAPAPGSSNGSSCSPDGAVVCNGPSQFAICNFGKAVFQPVAAGTTCEGGKIAKRHDVATTLVKKSRAA